MRLDYAALTPEPSKHLFAISAAVRRSALPGTIRELTAVYISQLNGCAHCIAVHWEKARAEGVPEEQLRVLPAAEAVHGDWLSLYDRTTAIALRLAHAVTVAPGTGVDEELWDSAVAALGEETLMWLIQHIMLMNAWNRLSVTLRIEPPKSP
ncbi:MAG: carboxymuconolactone decarboxylase family protein [Alkalispirochaeta sp.]